MMDRIKKWIREQSRSKDFRGQIIDAAKSSKIAAIVFLGFSLIGGTHIGLSVDIKLGFAFGCFGFGLSTAYMICSFELSRILRSTGGE